VPARSPALSRLSRAPALALAALLALPLSAGAHALLAKSEPARRAVLSKPPAQVRLWFNERLEPAFSSLSVLDAAGKPVTSAPARVAADDPKLLELALPTLAPGTYTVRYQVLSVDGHTVKSSYTFTVKSKAAAGPPRDAFAPTAARGTCACVDASESSDARRVAPAPGVIAALPALR
jgi:hypothetical protein